MDPLDNIWQVALALCIIVGLVALLGAVARRMQGGRRPEAADLRVLDSLYLGPKERVVLVQARDREVLIALNSNCITPLAEFSRRSSEQNLASGPADSGPGDDSVTGDGALNGFAGTLRRVLGSGA